MFQTLSIPISTTPLPPYGGESKAVWAAIAFCLLPSIVFYAYCFYYSSIKIFAVCKRLFPRAGSTVPLVEPESKTCGRKVRKWPSVGVPESIKPGSEFFTGVWPKCQLIIWSKGSDGLYTAIACAWRYDKYLITSVHCLPESGNIALSNETGDICELEYTVEYSFDELAVIKVHQHFLDEYGVQSARISPEVDSMVRVTGCDVKMATSIGLLRPTDIIATFRYSGSTRPGFSGAPYMLRDRHVVAMHICGGDIGNLCMSATYIKHIVDKLEEGQRAVPKKRKAHYVKVAQGNFEQPAADLEKKKGKNKKKRTRRNDWYTEDIDDTTDIRVRRSRFNPDEYEVEINGRFYTVDNDALGDLRRTVKQRNGHITYDTIRRTEHGDVDVSYGGDFEKRTRETGLEESSEESDSEDETPVQAFLGKRSKNSTPTATTSSADQPLSREFQVLTTIIQQCIQDSLISFESRKSKTSTLQSEGGKTKDSTS
nr:MAG: hypothetical protein 1 [Solemoviridae sp.]